MQALLAALPPEDALPHALAVYATARRREIRHARVEDVDFQLGVIYRTAERGFDLVSGGTDNHLILVELTSKDVPGKLAAQVLDRARITTNYNTFPFDPRKPFDPSGIRLGTPAVTTRGMTESEMKPIARWIDEGVEAAKREDEATINRIAAEVSEFAAAFPIPAVLA
jgi:glycine hydroxymethyltransferase